MRVINRKKLLTKKTSERKASGSSVIEAKDSAEELFRSAKFGMKRRIRVSFLCVTTKKIKDRITVQQQRPK